MKSSVLLWIIAFIITLAAAIYQRVTGPTYPLEGEVEFAGETISYKLQRSDDEESIISIIAPGNIEGELYWKRYKTDDPWQIDKMYRFKDSLNAVLPLQPPAGKLEYFIKLSADSEFVKLPQSETVIIRFKGKVPTWILIPHVIVMFGAMFLSTRTGLEIFKKNGSLKKLTYWTIGFLFAGGFILGPAVQLYAFDAWWTGFPFGTDLTDNKTLIAMIGWLAALFMLKRSDNPKRWVLGASIITLIIFMVPHSLLGSELDYSKIDEQQNELYISPQGEEVPK